ncbi:hypothetical protein GCM10010329_85690 [Streptomyces spiroverticillatus]|nr:hypothetical protein GCM10010329_85690 [Streptomyces spiroverticillatus]
MPGGGVTGALAAAAAATVSQSLGRLRPQASPAEPPLPHGGGSAQGPPSYEEATAGSAPVPVVPPPGYTPVPAGGFDPDKLTDLQLDALVHRIIGRVTRLVRTELRMDRERVGRLRDPRR